MAPPSRRQAFVLALALGCLVSCSVREDGLGPQLAGGPAAAPASRGGRPPTVLPDAGPMLVNPEEPIDPPAPTPPAQAGPDGGQGADASDDVAAGAPGALAALGQACTGAASCASGHCVDGVCCASACRGICEFCAAEATRGQCLPVSGAPPGGRPACMGTIAPCAGSCDGQDGARCRYPGAETVCAQPSCAADAARTVGTCTGTGRCSPRLQVECNGAGCSGTVCANGCSSSAECGANRYCVGGRCYGKQANGTPCARDESCLSGSCVDRVCCQRRTCSVCETCTGQGGTCVLVPPGVDPDSCTDGRTCSAAGACS
jgi:hypothetical protein